jgi:AraC-like DNA-binding protein
MTNYNNFHIDENWGLFVGTFPDNKNHKHFALQISVVSEGSFSVLQENYILSKFDNCFIKSNIAHQFLSHELHLTILINPISTIGQTLLCNHENENITGLNPLISNPLKLYLSEYQNTLNFEQFTQKVQLLLLNFENSIKISSHFMDNRISEALQYLEKNFDRIVSLKEISDHCCLSETRFLHLFKEKTNVNYRRYQLWNKLIKSIPYLRNHSITETAYTFGFSDSSHYTKTFNETFGLSPKFLSPKK